MNPQGIAVHVELRKALASRVLHTVTILVVLGIAVLSGTLVAAVLAGNEQINAKLGPLADETGWSLLTGVTAQITAAGALLAFGIALSWTFGREFTEGTITGLFALPVSRHTIALAKLCIHFLWTAAIALTLTVLVLAAGLILELGPVNGEALSQLARQAALTVLTGMIATPAGLAATLGRGPLPGIAVTLVILIAAQVTAVAALDTAAWLPLAAPALWALRPDTVHLGQLALVAIIPILFAALTGIAWRRLQLDR
ncbi:ABC-2 type transport system permease protein [Amycolatopsis marina]|uniref:ABC-2 type transport system permease protein n=1 Tax=Amycolatopsis marina TaxID=490629 RepID=A0A1I0WYL1_9PSEU|nr:ABC transporter permease [Amycolatopsis marina]SFA93218.1 ABC-2 type transport system permease protein [Amycolatopsis marina]